MRIAIDIREIGKKSTGGEVYTYHLIEELAELKKSQKHEFFLLTDRKTSEAEKTLPSSLPSNFKVFEVTPSSKIFWTFYSLPKFLKKNPVDVLHVQYISPFYLSSKVKLITTVHDISFRVNPKWIRKKDSFLLNNLIPPTLKRADAVITVSEFSRKEIVDKYGYDKKNIFVTYPAADIKCPDLGESKKRITEVLKGDFPYILHISSLQPRKKVPLVIRAFKKIKDGWEKENSVWKNTKLVVPGKRGGYNYDEEIDKAVVESGLSEDIVFPGYLPTETLPYLYRASLLFVLPSEYEGFGIPLIEAMSCKTPVVVSDIGSFKEVGGKAATMIDIQKSTSEQIEDLADKMKNLIENDELRKEKIEAGFKRKDLFSWNKMAEKTLEVYEKTAGI